jgi:arylsulfatase A-like enzyme
MRTLRWIVTVGAALAVAPACSGRAAAEDRRPNILLILADDLGWGDVGWNGSKIRTPVLDRLRREGVELTQHYVNPQCTPTRSSLLSGRYASRLDNLVAFNARAFPEGTMTLPIALQEAGYSTALIGKWHLGTEPGARPWERQGFDYTYGALTGAVHPWQHTYRKGPDEHTWHRNGRRLDETGTHTTDLLAREALAWLGRQDGKRPWFLYVPFFASHTPVDAPPEWKARYQDVKFFDDEKENESAVRYAAMTAQMDDAIGKLVDAVRARGWADRTLVVFHTDNGPVGGPWRGGGATYGTPPLPSEWLGSAAPLRGRKGTTWEGGVRVPALAYWPGVLAPRSMTAPACAADWFPTLSALAGWRPGRDLKWDGRDIWPWLTGAVARPPERVIYCKYAGGMAFLRRGDWKLVTPGDSAFARGLMPGDDRGDQLFNIADDPNETHDRAREEPAVLADLQRLLVEEMKQDEVGRVHKTALHQWSRVPEQARTILPAAPRTSTKD